jgi:NDP-sugar pyrophosphorylase family protein
MASQASVRDDAAALCLPTVVILCGGRGTRLQEHTHAIPKALVEIGGRPILWHVIQLYASQGFEDVVSVHRLPR